MGYRDAVPYEARCPICHWVFESSESQQLANEKAARCAKKGRPAFKYRRGMRIRIRVTENGSTFHREYRITRCYVEKVQSKHVPYYVLWHAGKATWDYSEEAVTRLVQQSRQGQKV